MTDTQSSRLLPALFEHVDESSPLSVLILGPALPETVDFFSQFRCKLHFSDLYPELPLRADPEREPGLPQRLDRALELPDAALFDVCLFWDVLNFLSRDAIIALMDLLRPHLHPATLGHCFAPHTSKTPASESYHGIADAGHFSVRRRAQALPDYQPHPQGELMPLMRYFKVDRSVLMPDRRIELLMKARL